MAKVMMSVSVSRDVKERVTALAEADGRSVSQWVQRALEDLIRHRAVLSVSGRDEGSAGKTS